MKTIKIKRIYPLIIAGVLLFLSTNCSKDSDGNDASFDKGFNPNVTYGTVTDVDSNVYKTVKIDNQIWMAENLKVTRYNDGSAIPLITNDTEWENLTKPGFCWYNNDPNSYKAKYGALYNFYATEIYLNEPNHKLCPSGWHTPNDIEWTTMENYLLANNYNYDGTIIDNKYAKALASGKNWPSSNREGVVGNSDYPDKINASGFTALPGGYRSTIGTYNTAGVHGEWWCFTRAGFGCSFTRGIAFNQISLFRSNNYPYNCGFSIRCVKD